MTESWKSVVPERDRLILERADFGGRQPWGRRPALLIVDVVRSFTGSKPQDVLQAIGEYNTSCGTSAWDTLPRMREVLDAARAAGIPVVYTKGDAEYKVQCGGSVKNEDPARTRRVHSTPIADEIAPRDGEFVISKTKASAFFKTPLPVYLVRHGIDSPDRDGNRDLRMRPGQRGRRLFARLPHIRGVGRLLRPLAVLSRRHPLRSQHQICDDCHGRGDDRVSEELRAQGGGIT